MSGEKGKAMSDEKRQRAMMAADLFVRAAKMMREGGGEDINPVRIVGGIALSLAIGPGLRDDSEYVRALGFCGLAAEDRRPCFNAIQRGEWPADSLAGRVEALRRCAVEERDARGACNGAAADARDHYIAGEIAMAGTVLDLLGVKP